MRSYEASIITSFLPLKGLRLMKNQNPIMALFDSHREVEPSSYYTWDGLADLLQNPTTCAKSDAAALAPQLSSEKTKAAVLANDSMTLLWADLDSGNQSIADIKQQLQAIQIGSAVIYSTASSTLENKRWRVLIELESPIFCDGWVDIQESLAILLKGDSSAVRVQQILYAPCRTSGSNHYQYEIIPGQPFSKIPDPVAKIIDDLKAKRKVVFERISETIEARTNKIDSGISLINDSVDIETLLKGYGYKRKGRKWISPNSNSKTAGMILFKNGRWFSHHASDSKIGRAVEGGVCGDVFDLITFFEYDNDPRQSLPKLLGFLDLEAQKKRRFEWVKNRGGS